MATRRRGAATGAVALAGALLIGGLAASPAAAVTHNGSVNCTYVSYVSLTIDAKGPGRGSWQNRSTSEVLPFTFPLGHTKKTTSWLNVNWSVTADAGFERTPYTQCGA